MSKYIKLEDAINELFSIYEKFKGSKEGKAIRYAIGYLQDLPTIEVSDEQLSKLKSRENSVENTTVSEDFTSISRAFHEQKEGEWKEQEDWDGDNYYDCSVCGESFVLIDGTPSMNLYHYCPNCGAKMKGSKNER